MLAKWHLPRSSHILCLYGEARLWGSQMCHGFRRAKAMPPFLPPTAGSFWRVDSTPGFSVVSLGLDLKGGSHCKELGHCLRTKRLHLNRQVASTASPVRSPLPSVDPSTADCHNCQEGWMKRDSPGGRIVFDQKVVLDLSPTSQSPTKQPTRQ